MFGFKQPDALVHLYGACGPAVGDGIVQPQPLKQHYFKAAVEGLTDDHAAPTDVETVNHTRRCDQLKEAGFIACPTGCLPWTVGLSLWISLAAGEACQRARIVAVLAHSHGHHFAFCASEQVVFYGRTA